MVDQSDTPSYLDIQAEVGITKHIGGRLATDALLDACGVAEDSRVLYVGSGVGIGPCYLAKTRGCRVVGVDYDPRMIEWSHRRAAYEDCESLVEFAVADVRELPFGDDEFDAVIVESVIAFVPEKQRAIEECVRVAKPGGCVGMNECVWVGEIPPEDDLAQADAMGTSIPTDAAWRELWDASGLEQRSWELHPIDFGRETRDRVEWIGAGWLARAWGRAAKLLLTEPRARASVRKQFSVPMSLMRRMAYVISAGRKPRS